MFDGAQMDSTPIGWQCAACHTFMKDPAHASEPPMCDHGWPGYELLPTSPPDALPWYVELKERIYRDLVAWPESGAGVRVRLEKARDIAKLVAMHPSHMPEDEQIALARGIAALLELAWNGNAVRSLEPGLNRVAEAGALIEERHKNETAMRVTRLATQPKEEK